MSKDISKLIEESLQNMEFPYDANAWKAMEKKLDAQKPIRTPKRNTNLFLAAAAVGILMICALAYVATLGTSEKNVPLLVKKAAGEKETSIKNEKTNLNTVSSDSKETLDKTTSLTPVRSESIQKNNLTPSKNQSNPTLDPNPAKIQVSDVNPTQTIQIQLPSLTKTVYCEGEKIKILNKNELALEVKSKSKSIKTLDPNSKTELNNLKPGYYSIVFNEKELMNFKVQKNPKADFVIDELLYDNGLPFNHVKATASDVQVQWLDNTGKQISTQNEFNAHFFTKGMHSIQLIATDKNGCSTTLSKQIQVESNYNLLAVTGFNPEMSDSRRNTFIPYALLERDVDFEMLIIDPKTGFTLFSSSDKNNPWNGVDPRTAELVPVGSTYIWKVKLMKGEVNEKTNYTGTITRM